MSNLATDILIIGGGVIGACGALYLTRAGREVTLVERGELCGEASRGNACWVAAGHSLPTAAPGVLGQGMRWLLDSGSPFHIKPRPSLDLARWLWRFRAACAQEQMMESARSLLELNRTSLALFRELAAEPGLDFGFTEDGVLHLHLSDKYRQAGEKQAALLRGIGVEARSLDRAGLEKVEPNLRAGIESGIFYPEHAHLDPVKLVEALAAQAEAEGATILTRTAVTGFGQESGRIRTVRTAQGTFAPREVVLAAGAWSSLWARELGAPILMQPAKGYSVTVKRRTAQQGPTRCLSVDDYKVAVTPLDAARFRFSSTLELAGFDPSINPKRLRVNRDALQAVLPDMESLDAEEPWSGYRPLTPDSLPYIGRSEQIGNLIFATGHGMLGITQGPITGKLVAEIVTGDAPTADLSPLRPERYA
ncbi:MAG: FAD-dependent oxidoreductase [Caldilineaceae bacterium]|nr:FAD-dependent oxidoreductase [Caldilineaceae bacterium]